HAREIPQTISRETAFHEATAEPVTVGAMLHYLTERACRATRALGLVPRTIGVRLRYADGVSAEAQRTPADASALDPAVHAVVDALVAKLWTRRVLLSHVGVVLSKFVPDGAAQLDLL